MRYVIKQFFCNLKFIGILYMTKQKIVFGAVLAGMLSAFSLSSCSNLQEEGVIPEESGILKIGVSADYDFELSKSRAVDEKLYTNIANYKVDIKKDNAVVKSFASATELPESMELENGSYTVEASYGTEQPKSRDTFLSFGSQLVNIEGNMKLVQLTCAPTCAKVKVNFGAEMDKYFSDYKVSFYTEALKSDPAIWAKSDADPWYLLVNKAGEEVSAKIELTPKDTYQLPDATIVKSYTLAPNQGWTLNINPSYNVSNGQLGLNITIDTTTNDHNVDIVVPSDWVDAASIN